MEPVSRSILIVNGGSSSIKFALFDACGSPRRTLKGQIERIGMDRPMFLVQAANGGESFTRPIPARDHTVAVAALMDWIEKRDKSDNLIAIGHRIVHGGPNFYEPHRLTPDLIKELKLLIPLDSEHLPEEVLLAETFLHRFPQLPQIACFDTAFHHDLPRVAKLLPIPRRYESQGIRRYGFHGISYEYLMSELNRMAGAAAGKNRVVLAHLGNGASLAAVLDGKPMDTSMAFTPAAGVPMSTRSGDLDPGLSGYLARTEKMSATQFGEMVNFKSGLLGISETSGDIRDLLDREGQDVRAAEAISLFCYQIKKWIGAFAAALGGLDTLVFAGGIGENSPLIRQRICNELGFLGIELQQQRNTKNASLISPDNGPVKVRVIHTDEELMIARSVMGLLHLDANRKT